MDILFITDQVYLHGGIERVLSVKANYLAKKKVYRIHIITSEQKNHAPCYDFHKNIQFSDLGINYIRNKSYFHPLNLIKLPKHIICLRKQINRINPDVIVVCSHSTDTFFIPLLFPNIPTVKEFHFSKHAQNEKKERTKGLLRKLVQKYSNYIESKYDKLVLLNKDEALYYKTKNTVIIPNPVTFFPSTVPYRRKKIALAAGRIAWVKGFEFMIEAWHKVHSEVEDWQLHIYGEGDPYYTNSLKEKVKALGLENKIYFLGNSDHIQKIMMSAGLFLMTSHNECFPLVLLEAQACGLPVVSFDCPNGPRNILDGESGILVPMGNINLFADSVLKFIQNPDFSKLLIDKAQDNVKKYSLTEVMPLWEELFANLTNKSLLSA
ncbi:glycosyltransferase family 4 protein [Lentiprolixibacter aurantiacus]|uniref:Glycosyltransferase family 4 protein n=1 Tax=Lentiprolixibacter aurantiacus TaxID=2993939 RepID=A0AAE3MMZ7_9FLAO|nr:glycosyltransferase family 4 protein [Lentiprolixibacter aurantiacus]MCX2719859.1 glycosyltransferase family 4 protein [Lentiprolixibacter aurantiacus]